LKHQFVAYALAGLGFVVAVGGVGVWGAERLHDSGSQLLESSAAIRSHMRADMMHDAVKSDVLSALLAAVRNDAAGAAEAGRSLQEHTETLRASISELGAAPLSNEAREALQGVGPALDDYARQAAAITQLAAQDAAAAEAARAAFQVAFTALETEMEALGDQIERDAATLQADGNRITVLAELMLAGTTLLAGGCLVALGVWLGRRTGASIGRAVTAAEAIAAGDLARPVPDDAGSAEAAQLMAAMRRMRDSLAQLVGSVHGSAESVATGSAQIATGNADLSARTEQAAANLQETAAAMEELTTTVRHNAEAAADAGALATRASAVAQRGGESMQRMVQTMDAIRDGSRRIADITSVIDGIAFQTNILALNAAVESARAGEHGRGFAVVAGEVRALAIRAAGAAREIKALVDSSAGEVGRGSDLASEVGQTMAAVVTEVRQMTERMDGITRASAEQARGIAQVGTAVAALDTATQQNAALVEEAAAAASSLNRQAAQMREAVAVFRIAGTPA
jgi:methyl-accepting chemotaxis protein